MNFRNISAWCIRNPVPPIVFFVGLMLAGIVSFMGMQVNNNPDIDFPAAEVNISQPGAAPSEMETQITQRIESAIRGVNGVDEINSSVREGNSNTFVQFEIGTPTDRAVNDIRDAIAQIRGDLPEGILEPQISRIDIAGDPILFVAAETTEPRGWRFSAAGRSFCRAPDRVHSTSPAAISSMVRPVRTLVTARSRIGFFSSRASSSRSLMSSQFSALERSPGRFFMRTSTHLPLSR